MAKTDIRAQWEGAAPGWARWEPMMQDAFGAYRAVVSDCADTVRAAAWAEVAEMLKSFETPAGFVAPAQVLVAGSPKPV